MSFIHISFFDIIFSEPPRKFSITHVNGGEKKRGYSILAVTAGEMLDLTCESFSGVPAPELKWIIGETQIKSSKISRKSFWKSTESFEHPEKVVTPLSLPVNKADDGKIIECQASHPALEKTLSENLTLSVKFPPSITRTIIEPERGIVKEGDSVIFTCQVESNTPASVSWYRLDSGHQKVFKGHILTLPAVSRHDAGTYQCQTENSHGLSQPSSQTLVVQCKLY